MNSDYYPGQLVYTVIPYGNTCTQYVPLVANRNRDKATYAKGNSFHRNQFLNYVDVPLPAHDLNGWLDVLNTKPPYPLKGKNASRIVEAHTQLHDLYRSIYVPDVGNINMADIYTAHNGWRYINNPYYWATITIQALEKLGHAVPYTHRKLRYHYISVVSYVGIARMPLELFKYFKFIAA